MIKLLYSIVNKMYSIPEMYSTVIKAQSYGVEGYYVENKYVDPRRIMEEKTLEISRQKSVSLTTRARDSSKKTTYIDDIFKRQAKLPGPTTYDPKDIAPPSKPSLKIDMPPRKTIFDEMQKVQQKFNFPAAGKYDKIEVQADKTKLKSNLSKAEVCSYLEDSMRHSIEYPGVGQYSARIQIYDHRGNKWMAEKGKRVKSQLKMPDVGAYNPHPQSYQLFDNISLATKGKSKSHFNREQRFKSRKQKQIPFYNIGSQWGMKNKLTKKDILSRVGSSLTHHSVYY